MVAVQKAQEHKEYTQAAGVCPLCFESFLREEFHDHVAAERRAIVEYTLQRMESIETADGPQVKFPVLAREFAIQKARLS